MPYALIMIAKLTGVVDELEERSVILDVHGVGYEVWVAKSLRDKLKKGDALSVRIYHRVGDDAETLYGFADQEALIFFELLLTVPSVGPRTALNILDVAPLPVLAQAVNENDTTLLTKVSGVGRKTASRIVVELKGKLAAGVIQTTFGSMQQDAIEALVSLGYSMAQAREHISRLPASVTSVEEAVRTVLKEKVH